MTEGTINGYTELVANPGMYITQSAEVWDQRVFLTRRLLTPNESASEWRDATAQEKNAYEQNTPPRKPQRTSLTPLFEAAGAVFNDDTGYYELNGITDIDEQEIIDTYINTHKIADGNTTFAYTNLDDSNVRTNFKINYHPNYGFKNINLWFSTIKVLNICPLADKNNDWDQKPNHAVPMSGVFDCYADKLEKIIGVIQFSGNNYNIVYRDNKYLKDAKFSHINKNINMSGMKNLNVESMTFAIDHATNTGPITIKVHADMYAKLTGDTTNAAAAALTPDELGQWTALAETATEKNITFATA